jgi:Zn-finger nucleic acid-binding protein
MNCPVCSVDLKMMERQGVEIDYCPKCRGVWLDRGELDKIIDRSAGEPHREGAYLYDQQDRHADHSGDYGYGHKKRRKRESFLSDLFDFD